MKTMHLRLLLMLIWWAKVEWYRICPYESSVRNYVCERVWVETETKALGMAGKSHTMEQKTPSSVWCKLNPH